MTNNKFREIRLRLGITQVELSVLLGYGSPMRISEFERATNPRRIPTHVALLMRAYDEGYRPKDWPV